MRCATCGRRSSPSAAFCGGCGRALSSEVQRPEAEPQGERRQLTVMFCDLVDSTELSHRLDPEVLRDVIRAYQETCAEPVERLGGRVAQYLGDGVLVYFGVPKAHEEDAVRAVSAALSIVEALPQLNQRLEEGTPELRDHPLQARIAVHTGPVVLAEMGAGPKREELALGETANLAAHLQGVAEPDTVVLSDATQHLLRGAFVLEDLGARSLKGAAEPIAIYRAIRRTGVLRSLEAETGLAPFVGRSQESKRLLDQWRQASGGGGSALLVRGEAGMGKTRLAKVFRERIADQRPGWFEVHCSPFHTNSVLYPVLASFERGLRFGPDDSDDGRIQKLERALQPSGFSLEEVIPLFARLLALPLPSRYPAIELGPEAQRVRTLECLVAWLAETVRDGPAVLLVEDLQWIDPSSLELLGRLLEGLSELPLLVLLTARPEFKSPWEAGPLLAVLELRPLRRRETTAMVKGVAGSRALPATVLAEVVAKADGVPLYAEELARAALESPNLEKAGVQPDLAVPSTLQDSLMARLDRLGPTKEVAQTAAVLGREFSRELLQAVSPLDALSLERALAELHDAALVLRSRRTTRPTYAFRHALLRDTAYESLLKSRRRALHRRVAEALEERFPRRVASEPEVAGWHFERAGLAQRAVSHYRRAAERAMEASAHAEAIEHLNRAIDLIAAIPEGPERTRQELALQVALGAPLLAARGYGNPSVEQSYRRVRELCREVAEGPELYQCMAVLVLFHLARAELDVAADLAAQFLEIGERADDPFVLKWGHFFSGARHYYVGEFDRALEHSEQAIALEDAQSSHDWYVHEHDADISARVYAAMSLSNLGHPARAMARMEQALELGRRNASPWNRAFALGFAAVFHHMRREPEAVLEHADEAIAIARKQEFPFWLAMGLALRGWARASAGVGKPAVDEMLRGVSIGAQSGTRIGVPRMLGVIGEAYGFAGMVDEAVDALKAALAMAKQTGSSFWDAELHRLLGQMLWAQDPAQEKEAEECLKHARAVAAGQGARLLELRALSSWVRLRRHQGRADDAAAPLADLYRGFTEGFDTPDLREARSLLEESSDQVKGRAGSE